VAQKLSNFFVRLNNTFEECAVQQQGGHIEHLMYKLQDVTVILDIRLTETINALFPVV